MTGMREQISLGPEEEVGIVSDLLSDFSGWEIDAASHSGVLIAGGIGLVLVGMFIRGRRKK